MQHSCPYCGQEQAVLAERLALSSGLDGNRSPWIFIECGNCAKRSLFSAISVEPPPAALPSPVSQSAEPPEEVPRLSGARAFRIAPEPPPFLATLARKRPDAPESFGTGPGFGTPSEIARLDSPEIPVEIPAGGFTSPKKNRRPGLPQRASLYFSVILICAGIAQIAIKRFKSPAAAGSDTASATSARTPAPGTFLARIAESTSGELSRPADPGSRPAPMAPTLPAFPARVSSPTTAGSSVTRESPIRVAVSKEFAILRSGPGTKFRRVGSAASELKLIVREWRGDWFRVEIDSVGARFTPREPATRPETLGYPGSAWIRNDLVRPMILTAETTPRPNP